MRVVKSGSDEFFATCRRCMCQFAYVLSDLLKSYASIGSGEYVTCPECGEVHTHSPSRVSVLKQRLMRL